MTGTTDSAAPTFSATEALALPGRCRGALMRHWFESANRRAGLHAADHIRSELRLHVPNFPDDPPPLSWWPVGVQLILADSLIRQTLNGKVCALPDAIASDAVAHSTTSGRLTLRALGPSRALRQACKYFAQAYDIGVLKADIGSNHATLRYVGAQVFAHPLWLPLQVSACSALIALCQRTIVDSSTETLGNRESELKLVWA